MPDLDDDLHVTAEAIGADAARIQAIEQEKATLDANDPRMVELSAESERLAPAMVPKARLRATSRTKHTRRCRSGGPEPDLPGWLVG
jgi:hypothetical protein